MNRRARERVVTAALLLCLAGVAGSAAWWSVQPPSSPELNIELETGEVQSSSIANSPIDASVFDLVLWPEPEPVVAEQATRTAASQPTRTPPPPPPAPINLALVAIVQEEQDFRVALYDPAEQRLVVAAEGERVGQVVVREVTADTVLLELAGRTRRLALREDMP